MTQDVTQDEGARRVRDYLLRETGRLDWRDLWPRVIGPRVALLDALAGVSEEQADWQAGDGWSLRQVAEHLLASSRNVLAIIESTAHGRTAPKDPPGVALAGPRLPFAEIRRALIDESERLASIRARLPEHPDDVVTVDHAFFGPLNARAWFLFQRIHDSDHLGQANAIKATPGYPATPAPPAREGAR